MLSTLTPEKPLEQLPSSESFPSSALVDGDDLVIFALFWADDCVLCGPDEVKAHRLWEVFTQQLQLLSLDWKPHSLELLVSGFHPPPDFPIGSWMVGETVYTVPSVSKFLFLGAMLNSEGDPFCIAEFRGAQAWTHFWARKTQFTCRSIPLRMRWQRLLETVGRTALYLGGSFGWHQPSINLVATTIRKMLGFTLCRVILPGEAWGEYHHRICAKVQQLGHSWACPRWSL